MAQPVGPLPNQPLHLTVAAILVLRDTKALQAAPAGDAAEVDTPLQICSVANAAKLDQPPARRGVAFLLAVAETSAVAASI